MTYPSPGEHLAAIQPSLIRTMAACRHEETLDLGLGEPDLPLPSALLEKAFACLKEGPMGYTPNAGLPDLRRAIAAHVGLSESHWERVIVTCGSAEALSSVMGALLSPGDEVITPEPSYPAYADLIRMFHGKNTCIPLMDADAQFVSALKDAATPQTRGLIINTPVNPTGQVLSEKTLIEIQKWAAEKKIWVISDEVYRTLYAGGSAPSLLQNFPDAFVVGGLSKSISMTGFRLGWVIAPQSCVNAICQIHRLTVTCAPRLSQLLALEVFRQPESLLPPAQIYEERRRQIIAKCKDLNLPVVHPEGAFYLWLDVREQTKNTLQFCQRLHEETSVLAIPGEAFGAAGQGFIRLSYAVALKVFFEGLERINHFLNSEEKNHESQ